MDILRKSIWKRTGMDGSLGTSRNIRRILPKDPDNQELMKENDKRYEAAMDYFNYRFPIR